MKLERKDSNMLPYVCMYVYRAEILPEVNNLRRELNYIMVSIPV